MRLIIVAQCDVCTQCVNSQWFSQNCVEILDCHEMFFVQHLNFQFMSQGFFIHKWHCKNNYGWLNSPTLTWQYTKTLFTLVESFRRVGHWPFYFKGLFQPVRKLHFLVDTYSLQKVSKLLPEPLVDQLLLVPHPLVMNFDLANSMAARKHDPESGQKLLH